MIIELSLIDKYLNYLDTIIVFRVAFKHWNAFVVFWNIRGNSRLLENHCATFVFSFFAANFRYKSFWIGLWAKKKKIFTSRKACTIDYKALTWHNKTSWSPTGKWETPHWSSRSAIFQIWVKICRQIQHWSSWTPSY